MGIAHSFAPVALWAGAALALLAASGWSGLRTLGAGRGTAALAVAAVVAVPVLGEHLNTPKNDLPATAWLAACAALCAGAVRGRPALLGPALAAAGLAVGTKTTMVPLAAIVLAASVWRLRGTLHAVRAPLAGGAVAGAATGLVWYVRNVVEHGWPLWPLGSGPFGDPEPVYLRRIDVSFLERARDTVAGREDLYLRLTAGGLVLAAGGILAVALRRRDRLVAGASGATLLAALAWTAAPFTGRADHPALDLSVSTTRYLLPVYGAGAAALALAGRSSRVARALLLVALAWSAVRTAQIGFPWLPSGGTLLAGAVAGGVAALLAGRGALRLRLLAAGAALVAVVGAARAADGWLGHVAETGATAAAPVEAWFAARPGWAEDRAPVAFTKHVVGPLAGDRLRHELILVPGDEPCARTLARAREGWVVVRVFEPAIEALLAPPAPRAACAPCVPWPSCRAGASTGRPRARRRRRRGRRRAARSPRP